MIGLKFEVYGIEPIPAIERKSGWLDLFLIWAGSSICLPSFVLGAMLVPAFAWQDALAINLLGNLVVGLLIAAGGMFGVRAGQPAVMMGRHVFGNGAGQLLPTWLLLISMLGWFAVITALTGQSINYLLQQRTGFSSPALVIIIVGVINSSTAVAGYKRIRSLSLGLVPLLALACVVIIYRLSHLGSLPVALAYTPVPTMSFGQGLNIIIGGSIAGALIASDYSRYSRSGGGSVVGTLGGTFLVSFLLGILGMISQAVTGSWNPLLLFEGYEWFVLVFTFLAAWTTNDNLLYSCGLALSNLVPTSRWINTVICGLLGIVLALLGISEHITSWLNLLSTVIPALLGVLLAHLVWMGRAFPEKVNWKALLATAAGALAACLVPAWLISSLVSLGISFMVYSLMMAPGRLPKKPSSEIDLLQ